MSFQCQYGDYVEPCSFMDKFIYPFFAGVDESGIAVFIKSSPTIIPWAGSFHLLALGLIGGAIFMADARALGAGPKSISTHSLYSRMKLFLLVAIAGLVLSGTVLALGEMMRLYESPPYWVKMWSLVAILVFTFTARRAVFENEGKITKPAAIIGGIAILMWAIPFLIMSGIHARVAMILMWIGLGAAFWYSSKQDDAEPKNIRIAAMISIAMWLTTAVAGRWIAFY